MIRVAFGWIGGAGRQPAAVRARRSAPSGSCGPSASISGSIRRWLIRPAEVARSRRTVSVNAPIASASQVVATGPARGVGETPRHRSRPADEDLGADPLGVTDALRGPAVDGLDPGPGGGLEVRPGVARGDEPVPVGIVGHDLTGRRSRSAMTPTIDGSSGIRKASETTA